MRKRIDRLPRLKLDRYNYVYHGAAVSQFLDHHLLLLLYMTKKKRKRSLRFHSNKEGRYN
jgi:hypothetical protein